MISSSFQTLFSDKNPTANISKLQKTIEDSFDITSSSSSQKSKQNDSKLEISLSNINPRACSNTNNANIGKPLNILIDTNRIDAGLLSADITLNDKKVNFELIKLDATKYEIKLTPTSHGVYKVRLLLNGLTVKGSPFIIKINNGSQESNHDENAIKKKPPVSSFRTELIEDISSTASLFVGKEFQLRVFLVEKTTTKESNLVSIAKNVKLHASVKLNNTELVEHRLEANQDGSFTVSATPQRPGSYFVSFYKDERRVDGSPYKLVVSGRAIKTILKPNYSQVGKPYILTLDNYDPRQTRIEISRRKSMCLDSSSLTSVSKSISSTTMSTTLIGYERIVEEKSRLVIRFVPMEAVEHLIDVFEMGKLIKGEKIFVKIIISFFLSKGTF